jgi:sarcosine oxidase subunit alpha
VATALKAAGERVLTRSVKYHRPRGAFCHAGHCGTCLVRIDGEPNRRACMTPLVAGMEVTRQNAYPSADFDVLAAADFVFSRGMDHHHMFTRPKFLSRVVQKVVRQLAGLGLLPDEPRKFAPVEQISVETLVVGGGPAGLAAATAQARRGRRTLLVDEQPRLGGSWLADPRHGLATADRAVTEARTAGVELRSATAAVGWYAEEKLLALLSPTGLTLATAERYIHCTGAYDQNLLFVDNDRPGVLSARALGRLLVRDQVLAGRKPLLVGAGAYVDALAGALSAAGAEVERIDGRRHRLTEARGGSWLRSALTDGRPTPWVTSVEIAGGKRLACDVVGVFAPPAPASELSRQHGAAVKLDAGGFAVIARDDGACADHVFVAGDVTGYIGPEAAAEAGARVGAGA